MLLQKKMLTCFYKNGDTSTMAKKIGELKFLTGSVIKKLNFLKNMHKKVEWN